MRACGPGEEAATAERAPFDDRAAAPVPVAWPDGGSASAAAAVWFDNGWLVAVVIKDPGEDAVRATVAEPAAPRFAEDARLERTAVCCLINVKPIEPVRLARLEMKLAFEVCFGELAAVNVDKAPAGEDCSDAAKRRDGKSELTADSVVYLMTL